MKLAPRMIQSMEILQMASQALEERLEQELASNPTLELRDASADPDQLEAEKQQTERDANDWHTTVISPFADGIRYGYYDADLARWRMEDEPLRESDGVTYRQPARIEITYSRGKRKTVSQIELPLRREGASQP